MKKNEMIDRLQNTVIPSDCPGWPPSVDRARLNLIDALLNGELFIDYVDHNAVQIPGPCVCVRNAVKYAGLEKDLLVHTGIYTTTVTFFTDHYNPDFYN
jgi:hypothetical protein